MSRTTCGAGVLLVGGCVFEWVLVCVLGGLSGSGDCCESGGALV